MKVLITSAHDFERPFFEEANAGHGHDLEFLEATLQPQTAVLAEGSAAVVPFVNDRLDAAVLRRLADGGTRLIALRSAGFNHVDVQAAAELDLTVARVPAYSPEAVAEHTVALVLCLDRRIHRAHARVREGNFSLGGLVGFNLHGRTVGIVGMGRIGIAVARIFRGFGCRLLAHDPAPSEECHELGVELVALDELFSESDVVTLHCPLTPETHHLVEADALAAMKEGVMIVNTSRGAVVDTRALIDALKSGRVGAVGLDVYEEEGDLFFRDLSDAVIRDDVFARLTTFPNVLITAHQAFLTREALQGIAGTTLANVSAFAAGSVPETNLVTPALIAR